MDRSRDRGQSSKAEGTRRRIGDMIRRQASSSSKGDAGSPNQTIERTHHDQIKEAHAQAIDRGKAKWQRYQQEAERYKNKDKDTLLDFKNTFGINKINPNYSLFEVEFKNIYHGTYINAIDLKNGGIIGIDNTHVSKKEVHFSEIVFNQLLLVLERTNNGISQFDLKYWYGKDIMNEDTIKTVELFFPEEINEDKLVKKGKKTFLADTDAFIALAGTPTAQSKFYLLAQHPKAFPDKQVTSITVIRHSHGQIDIWYQFGSKLEQQKKASPKASL